MTSHLIMRRGAIRAASLRHPDNLGLPWREGGRAKEDRRTRDIGRLARATAGNAFQNLAAANRIISKRDGIFRSHVTRCDGIDVDPFGGPLIRKGFGQLCDATFASCI